MKDINTKNDHDSTIIHCWGIKKLTHAKINCTLHKMWMAIWFKVVSNILIFCLFTFRSFSSHRFSHFSIIIHPWLSVVSDWAFLMRVSPKNHFWRTLFMQLFSFCIVLYFWRFLLSCYAVLVLIVDWLIVGCMFNVRWQIINCRKFAAILYLSLHVSILEYKKT